MRCLWRNRRWLSDPGFSDEVASLDLLWYRRMYSVGVLRKRENPLGITAPQRAMPACSRRDTPPLGPVRVDAPLHRPLPAPEAPRGTTKTLTAVESIVKTNVLRILLRPSSPSNHGLACSSSGVRSQVLDCTLVPRQTRSLEAHSRFPHPTKLWRFDYCYVPSITGLLDLVLDRVGTNPTHDRGKIWQNKQSFTDFHP